MSRAKGDRQSRNARVSAQADADVGALTFTAAERVHASRVVDIVGPIVEALASALGPSTEVVLHDLTRMPTTIAAISGYVTHRSVGGPPTDLGLRTFQSGWREHLINYRTETEDGAVLRSSSLFFHAPSGKPVACLCLNSDVSALLRAQDLLGALTAFAASGPFTDESSPAVPEHFPTDVETLIESILKDAIQTVGVPLALMKKAHKVEVVRELEERGFFTIRDAADTAAARLGVSRYSIYNYLNEVQAQRSEDAG